MAKDHPIPSRFFAHSTSDPTQSNWQPLVLHLQNVGRLARQRAAHFGAEDLADAAGRLHDIGKYTTDFQRRIAGDAIRVDHASRGAMLAVERYKSAGFLLAYAIAGHHAGLANGAEPGQRTALRDRLRGLGLPPLLDAWKDEITLPDVLILPRLNVHSRERGMFQLTFLARMLFSCLVDADYLDTEAFYEGVEGRCSERSFIRPSVSALRDRLNSYLGTFRSDTPVNRIRAETLHHIRQQATLDPGLFSLTVPTGGGKTLASFAFALDHAMRYGHRRVIFVIPFTSIVEQNAKVFRDALGSLGEVAVLEHHSAFISPSTGDPERYQAREKLKLAMENWDAPVIVTTAVQFFESLFAARPAKCRKIHNISSSVIILDEAQTLPLKVLRPIVAAIDELAQNYRCSVVLCTATQPALNAPEFCGGLNDVRELAPDPAGLFRKLDRVRIRHLGSIGDDDLTARLRGHLQVLCIVNNRRHARALYQAIADQPGARHLSTLMCAKHRSDVIAEIRDRLAAGKPCRLVATSLIEAGVDISFPVVYRAEAGLDSIAQAAGRCNRHGERPVEDSHVLIFSPLSDDWAPPAELRQFAEAGREVLRSYIDSPLSPSAMTTYFQHLYWRKGEESLDAHALLELTRASRVDSLPMETLATRFRMIETTQMPVIVPYDYEAEESINALRYGDGISGLARRLQPYLVQIPRQGYDALRKVGAIQPIVAERWGEQFVVLLNKDIYGRADGIWWEDPTFVSPATMII